LEEKAVYELKELIIDWQILNFRSQEGAWEIYDKDTVNAGSSRRKSIKHKL
jgi:hypothetical protein